MLSAAANLLDKNAITWLTDIMQRPPERISPVAGGKNNRGLIVTANSHQYFLKEYFSDDCHRFQRETDFVRLLGQHNVSSVAQLIGTKVDENKDQELALFSLLPGKMPTQINQNLVMQAAKFIADINQPEIKEEANHILPARGGLGLAGEFIREIERRLESFQYLFGQDQEQERKPEEQSLYQDLEDFLRGEFKQVFKKVESKVMTYFGEDLQVPFPRVLSPSDFGFHNTLLDSSSSQLHFFDFEYSGWDSAEKLITDFFAQPRFTIDPNWLPEFVCRALPDNEETQLEHCLILLPLAHLKWALIYLNDFKHTDSERRSFATEHTEQEQLEALEKRKLQLEKAKQRVAIL